jgi:hypothetical protein
MAKASFAAGVRFARGLLPQDELLPSHVVVALGLWFSELASAVDLSGFTGMVLVKLLLDARRLRALVA